MLKTSTIFKLRRSQSAAEDSWESLMDAYKRESEGDVVASIEDICMLVQAAVEMNKAVRLIEQLRYKHDANYSRES